MTRRAPSTDRALALAIERWFARNMRPFPWRPDRAAPGGGGGAGGGGRDPYTSLVSEFMLQQTQASRIAQRLPLFLARFPDIRALARARESSVLAAWQGLGYYRRARLLHQCAKSVVDRFDAVIPADPASLRSLPGIGDYTAGALASIVFGRRAPLVDANVARVILRLEGKPLPIADPAARDLAWQRSAALVRACRSPALLNEGLMELGALLCNPRNPDCPACPLASRCIARRLNAADRIPLRAPKPARQTIHHAALIVRHADCILLQQRANSADAALWPGMWQPPTLERADRAPTPQELSAWSGLSSLIPLDRFDRLLSHRRVRFTIWAPAAPIRPSTASRLARLLSSAPGANPPDARNRARKPGARNPASETCTFRNSAGETSTSRNSPAEWKSPAQIARLPFASPHRRILESHAGLAPT